MENVAATQAMSPDESLQPAKLDFNKAVDTEEGQPQGETVPAGQPSQRPRDLVLMTPQNSRGASARGKGVGGGCGKGVGGKQDQQDELEGEESEEEGEYVVLQEEMVEEPPPKLTASAMRARLWRVMRPRASGALLVPQSVYQEYKDLRSRPRVEAIFEKCAYKPDWFDKKGYFESETRPV